MMISHFLHAALLVSDLHRSSLFYGTVLGLAVVDRPLDFPGIWYQIGAMQLHLMVNENPINDAINDRSATPIKWGRNRHLAFAIEDLERCKTQLESYGCPVQLSASGRPALFTQDPDGNVIELTQIHP